jgi:hypothetical protein
MAPYREEAADEFCNNVVYNCRGGYTDDGHGNRARSAVNLYRNYYKRGPQTMERIYPYALSPFMDYYVKDNYFEDWGTQGHPKGWKYTNQPGGVPTWIQMNNNGRELSEKAPAPSVTTSDARENFPIVLSKAGCWPRDRVTARTIQEVRLGTGSWGRNAPMDISNEWLMEGLPKASAPIDSDGDGMPDAWERQHRLNQNDPKDANKLVPQGASAENRHEGYTFVEFYLNELADNLLLQ